MNGDFRDVRHSADFSGLTPDSPRSRTYMHNSFRSKVAATRTHGPQCRTSSPWDRGRASTTVHCAYGIRARSSALFEALHGVAMAMRRFSTFPVLLLAALQVGCAAMPGRAGYLPSSLEVPRPSCDTSIRYIQLSARLRNTTDGDIAFHLVGDRGPPVDPWYLGYRVYSSAPGEQFRLVHNSGHDSEWTRTLVISPGDSVEFNIPIFGLRPADYYRYFRIELRDSERRSYWTPAFELCPVSQSSCGCPLPGSLAVGSQAPRQVCPTTPPAGPGEAVQVLECRPRPR